MSEESDDSDSSDSSRQKIFIAAGIILCFIQFAFFIYMIQGFMELNYNKAFVFMSVAYTSAFIYRNLESRGAIQIADKTDKEIFQ
jgi:ABC-type multidrug transport system permease subunit